LEEVLQDWSARAPYQAVLASSSSLAPYLRTPALEHVPAVVDLIDVDSQKWFDYAQSLRGPKSWLFRLEGRRVVMPVGNGVDLDYFQPRPEASEHGCVFVGALDYLPNVEGIDWFCRAIWPAVRLRHPDATLALVGRRPAPAVARLAAIPGVELVGQVPDVRPYLAGAAVSIAPLRIARGIQNKVLESLAMAKATLVSPQALLGLQAQPGDHLATASTPAEWIERLSHLLDDAALRRRLGEARRQFVERHHDWDRCLTPLDKLLPLFPRGAFVSTQPALVN
jgi:glycosyltransferase involved in cell wall biosynthesis